ncbi:MAG: GC-type dockerin domain-anchored protein [Planctomycetota bacterium]
MIQTRFACAVSLIVGLLVGAAPQHAAAQDPGALGERVVEIYEVQQYWVRIPPVGGNPFDVDGTVTFSGSDGSEIETPMFYDGPDDVGRSIYRFRFTGQKPGVTYQIETQSNVSGLDGHTGRLTTLPSSDPDGWGFVQAVGNRFAVERGPNGVLTGFLLNIVQTDPAGSNSPFKHLHLTDLLDNPEGRTRQYARYARDHGFTAIYVLLTNHLLTEGAFESADVTSDDPNIEVFRKLDRIVETAHEEGLHVHFWRWGDANRGWSPQQLPGGINGSVDRELTEYIGARLGPLPSWSIGYGFDLHEWVTPAQLESWRDRLVGSMGFPHVLSARSYRFSDAPWTMIGYSQGDTEMGRSTDREPDYNELRSLFNSNSARPHLLEERNVLGRWGVDSDDTRMLMWRAAMAGGVGGWYGFFESDPAFTNDAGYTNQAALKTHADFWRDRFQLDMQEDNDLTRGASQGQFALRSPSTNQIVVFGTNTSRVDLNLAGLSQPLEAVAVDTRLAYNEINLGSLSSNDQQWNAPYQSDWAISINGGTEPVCLPDLNGDGQLDGADFNALVVAYNSNDLLADLDNNGTVDTSDVILWITLFFQGC